LQRPDVVLFDEFLPSDALGTLDRELRRGFDLYLSIGTSSTFPYILQPILQARTLGLPTIEINPAAETDISRLVSIHLPLGAAEALSRIADQLAAN
jgi:NAD-dependent deacetylase